jgi:RimJ/RimL family protein N-acetyltransferase
VTDFRRLQTDRLTLAATHPNDAEECFPFFTDPEGWWYAPESRHLDLATTRGFLERSSARWDRDRLSYWTVRRSSDGVVIGVGGAQRHRSDVWNLSYRLAASSQGNGYAVELGRAAITAAREVDPSVPVIAWVAEINAPSRAVAERLGLTNYGPRVDANDGETRLAYADRELGEFDLSAAPA